jgi:hypothetical protein
MPMRRFDNLQRNDRCQLVHESAMLSTGRIECASIGIDGFRRRPATAGLSEA